MTAKKNPAPQPGPRPQPVTRAEVFYLLGELRADYIEGKDLHAWFQANRATIERVIQQIQPGA